MTGQKVKVNPEINGEPIDGTFSSTDPNVLEVTSEGIATGLQAGNADVKLEYVDNYGCEGVAFYTIDVNSCSCDDLQNQIDELRSQIGGGDSGCILEITNENKDIYIENTKPELDCDSDIFLKNIPSCTTIINITADKCVFQGEETPYNIFSITANGNDPFKNGHKCAVIGDNKFAEGGNGYEGRFSMSLYTASPHNARVSIQQTYMEFIYWNGVWYTDKN